MSNLEKDLYPIIKNYLEEKKECYPKYTDFELSLKRGYQRLRADVFGVNKEREIFLCEGKRELKNRVFGKAISEVVELLKYANYVYVFGTKEDLKDKDPDDQIEKCRKLSIGILTISDGEVREILKPQKNEIDHLAKKEIFFRIFTKYTKSPIADIIFQATFEYLNKFKLNLAPFIDIYNSLFKKEEYKDILRDIIRDHTLEAKDMRKEFQRVYGKSEYVEITRKGSVVDDLISLKKEGLPPILLD